MPHDETDQERLDRLERAYQASGPATRRPRRRRRSLLRGAAVLAFVLLVVGVIPIAQYVDAATVPDGTTAQQAEVLRLERTTRTRSASARRNRGRSAVVRLPDGSEDRVYLATRLDYPEPGDTLTVYREDDRLRTTAERSRLQLAGGVLALLVLPALTGGWLLSRRRQAG